KTTRVRTASTCATDSASTAPPTPNPSSARPSPKFDSCADTGVMRRGGCCTASAPPSLRGNASAQSVGGRNDLCQSPLHIVAVVSEEGRFSRVRLVRDHGATPLHDEAVRLER